MAESFIKALTVRDSQGSWRLFNALECKDGKHLSIQASRTHYCYPAENLPVDRIGEYETWEIAMIGQGGGWFIPTADDPVYGQFADLWTGDDVCGYVPTERVQALYEAACL